MPEFKRNWKEWAPENLPADPRDGTAKTDKSPSVSFGKPIAEPRDDISGDVEPSQAAEDLPLSAQDRTDKTDERSAGAAADPDDQMREADRQPANACLVAGCRFTAHVVELGGGFTTSLCAVHRRELFTRARTQLQPGEDARLLARRPCRYCGRPVEPEDDPCRQCTAARSPLVQTALQMGAKPLCACGSAVERPGDVCEECRRDQP